jgi:ribonuclease J
VVDLVDGKAKITGKVQAGYVYVDGLSVGDVTETHLKDRRILGDEGIISVFVVVDSTTGKVVGGPHFQARGSGIDDAAFSAVLPKVDEAIARSAQDGVSDPHQLQQLVRRTVGKWVSDTYRRRPMILPVVVEV